MSLSSEISALARMIEDNKSIFQKIINQVPSNGAQHANNSSNRVFSPNFDVWETPDSYILDGELPGVKDKSRIEIEFIDSQTLVIHGRIERPTILLQTKEVERTATPKRLYPVVDDKMDEDVKPPKGSPLNSSKIQSRKPEPQPVKCWVSERAIGEYERRFSFPASVDLDRVTAALEDGLLRIIVPKMQHAAGKKIAVQ
ncbi:hypothetical protein RUND412_006990 [Rhizina undulata]